MKPSALDCLQKALPIVGVSLLLCATPLQAGSLSFAYDGAGRLTAARSTNNFSIAYAYDSAGNLLQRQFSIGGNADSDGDGMDDGWEQQHFGNLSRNGAGDFDGDGFRDLHEFVAGTIPNDAGSSLKLFREVTVNGTVTVQWQSVSGKTYRLQFKNALPDADWADLPGTITAGGATASRSDNPPSNQNSRFYRVILVQ